jgi:hypothetical protein
MTSKATATKSYRYSKGPNMTSIQSAEARPDNDFSTHDIKEARQMARDAIANLMAGHVGGAVWYGAWLENKVGTTRARKLLGKHADRILQK